MKKSLFVEIQILIIIFILAFAEFAPVSAQIYKGAFLISYGIGVINCLIGGYNEVKSGNFLSSYFIFVLASVLLFIGERQKIAIILLSSILIVKNQILFLKNSFEVKKQKILNLGNTEVTVFYKGKEVLKKYSELEKGNVILLKPQSTILVEGLVFNGSTNIRENLIEGDTRERLVENGDYIFSNSVNLGQEIQVEVVKNFENSWQGQKVEAMKQMNIQDSKLYQKMYKLTFVIKVICLVVGFGISFIPMWFMGRDYNEFLYWSGLVFSLSIGDVFYSIYGYRLEELAYRLNERGIINRSIKNIEILSKIDSVLVQDTSNIIRGEYELVKIENKSKFSKEELLVYAAHLAKGSDSLMSKAIVDAFMELARYEGIKDKDPIRWDLVTKFENLEEKGIAGRFRNKFICVGNKELMALLNISDLPVPENKEDIYLHISVDGNYCGYFSLKYKENAFVNKFNTLLSRCGVKQYATVTNSWQKTAKDMKKSGEGLAYWTMDGRDLVIGGKELDINLYLDAKETNRISELADVTILNGGLEKASDLIKDMKKFLHREKRFAIVSLGVIISALAVSSIFPISMSLILTFNSLVMIGNIYRK